MEFWENLNVDVANDDEYVDDIYRDDIHIQNFECSIDTRLHLFYLKIFHKAN